MPDPSTYRPAPGSIPLDPGVYRFRDSADRVIYVGKAKSLRQRLNSYFADLSALHPRTRQMVTTAARVEWTVVNTDVEALQLEYSWIKEFDPRFNVKYRDDKSYPWLAVTLGEEFPRLQVMRGPKRKGVRYFGPYSHAWAIRETLDLLLRVFPARTCSKGVFVRAGQIDRPCLLGYIDKCSAPCVGRVSAEEHRGIVDDFCDFMAGRTDLMMRRVEKAMQTAAADQEYERAARLRDDLGALRRALEKQAVVFGDGTDADVVGFAEDDLEAAVQVFHVRGGRIRGQRGWVIDKVASADEKVDTGVLVDQFIGQFYGVGDDPDADDPDFAGEDGAGIPREILVPHLPDDVDVLSEWLSSRRGSRVTIRVPQRGDKVTLMETVKKNAAESFLQHKLKRASDLTARSMALAELQEHLDLPDAPLRIECFDISHVQGTNVVASMVVFEDGLARKSEYRRFALRDTSEGTGDVQWIAEVTRRRFARYLDEQIADGPTDDTPNGPIDPETGRPRKFAYAPNLLVVDGGAPQVAAAHAVLQDLGITDVSLVGLAKRLEEVWLPEQEFPAILPRTSEALYLLQRVRDEAHRFAITYHRQKRSKSMTVSALDGVAGLGETRRKALLKRFGSLKLRAATAEEIQEVSGIGPATAEAIVAALHDPNAAPAEPAVNVSTGEVLDSDPRDDVPVTDSPDDAATPTVLETVVVTGLSGAGRSTAAKCLEDLGYYVVDNLPPELLATMVDLGSRSQGAISRIAVVMDVRSRPFSADLRAVIRELDDRGLKPRVLFLEAAEDVLVRRFESNRREHPLQGNDGRLVDGIARERLVLAGLREEAELVVDTGSLSVHQLRRVIEGSFPLTGGTEPPHATVLSFGYKYGLPVDADLVVDVRFLPNPHWIPDLRPLTGETDEVRDYVMSQDGVEHFLDLYGEVLQIIGAGYAREGKRYMTLAVGCTGGKHRSVVISRELAARLTAQGVRATVVHRDVGRE